MRNSAVFRADVLVIGGGGAGLLAAIKAREEGADVLLVSKSRVGYGNNTCISKSAFAVATGRPDLQDDPDTHLRDSLSGGCFINDRNLLEMVVHEIPSRVGFLERCGVRFQREGGELVFGRAAGHSRARNIRSHAWKGSGYTLPLRSCALGSGVRFMENVTMTRLLKEGDRFSGGVGLTPGGDLLGFQASSCVLATGGFAQIYFKTNNAAGTTGDGLALVYELGLSLRDMEFVQFYPTALGEHGRPMLLYEEILSSPGAVLKNGPGEDIIEKHGLREPVSLTRDRLARAIFREIQDGLGVERGVVLDIRRVRPERLARLRHMLPAGWRPEQTVLIVSPTTHFCMGGVVTNEWGETELAGLYAAGETCGGAHGANRLAGNALAEAFVMGAVAGERAARYAKAMGPAGSLRQGMRAAAARLAPKGSGRTVGLRELRKTLKRSMWNEAGIIRDRDGLDRSLAEIERVRSLASELRIEGGRGMIAFIELQNMLLASEIVSRAALARTESRGAHYRRDYPEQNDGQWMKRVVVRKTGSGMRVEPVPIAAP